MSPALSQRPYVLGPVSAPIARPPSALRMEPVDSLDAVRATWTALAQQGQSVFATWEFASTWWKHFGGRRTLLTVARHRRGR